MTDHLGGITDPYERLAQARSRKDAADEEFEAALRGAIYDAFVIGAPMSDVMMIGRVSRGTVDRRIKEML